MDSLQFNNGSEDGKPILTTATDSQSTTTTESFAPSDSRGASVAQDTTFSPLASPFQSIVGNGILKMMQDLRVADTAPSAAAELEDVLMKLRLNGNESLFDEMENNPQNCYNMGSRTEGVAGSQSNIWAEGNAANGPRNSEMIDTFDFLIKSLSAANNYVAMLTREQLSILRCIRPSLLYEMLHEVTKVRSDKRMRKALPNECAFCKNNGENEETFMSHALKDWRGRVECPVLRAFRCPRCGATGDRAHTIKYCPENGDPGLDRSGLVARRRATGGLQLPRAECTGPTPAPSPATTLNHSLWANFGMN